MHRAEADEKGGSDGLPGGGKKELSELLAGGGRSE
jgi:hypothetical protein